MREFKLPKRTLLLWQIRLIFLGLISEIICYMFLFGTNFFLPVAMIVGILFLLIIFLYLPNYYALFKIKCLKDAVVVENGIFIKKCHILPFSRLIYSQCINTPLSKPFGVTAITLKAARSFILVPEMLDTDAKEFLTILVKGDVL